MKNAKLSDGEKAEDAYKDKLDKYLVPEIERNVELKVIQLTGKQTHFVFKRYQSVAEVKDTIYEEVSLALLLHPPPPPPPPSKFFGKISGNLITNRLEYKQKASVLNLFSG